MTTAFQPDAFQTNAFQIEDADTVGSGCATARSMNRASISAGPGYKATLSVQSVNGIAIRATARDCC